MEQSSTSPALGKRLWHTLRAVYYMIGKGFTKHKLMMELSLLLKRGKIAGKALGNLMTFHQHHHHNHASSSMYSSFTCRSMDPNLAYYDPSEVEFSCSTTPSFPPFHAAKRKSHRRGRGGHKFDAATVAKALEMLNSEMSDAESSVMPSPSATPLWNFDGKSPAAAVRPLRITDSPFPAREEEEEDVDGHVDMKAEEFIRRFYEELQRQQSFPETPDNWYGRRHPIAGRA